jgi:hypothetical protein
MLHPGGQSWPHLTTLSTGRLQRKQVNSSIRKDGGRRRQEEEGRRPGV